MSNRRTINKAVSATVFQKTAMHTNAKNKPSAKPTRGGYRL